MVTRADELFVICNRLSVFGIAAAAPALAVAAFRYIAARVVPVTPWFAKRPTAGTAAPFELPKSEAPPLAELQSKRPPVKFGDIGSPELNPPAVELVKGFV